ncbi:hypothetical protein Pmar_PMAR001080 [Perkinsus marinus ATCC 50983]|uniref:Peptidase C1A papain C-terminal domain-containing protein n=1 Tax=Perkinsus marinus (strain ATCC 50983 / TXsc) TaxID=423536 RepID=C5KST3_PERM5|nr:hypothetical protein Pmar_PMAR001080 [Perkinsus marinus ATCC 50983]EER12283.1 hypothetical protein Pmar_PMAR001080 [Perkinsus marinus ATCC 50983]|eukprot:XP_002780488.1 hypothetical protein Pmar_PMAR001080 [Perkinsus marinus ATCC 50983]
MLVFVLHLAVVTAEYTGAYKEKHDDHRMKIFADDLRYTEKYDTNLVLPKVGLSGCEHVLKLIPECHTATAGMSYTLKVTPFTPVENLPRAVNYVAKGWVTAVQATGGILRRSAMILAENILNKCSRGSSQESYWGPRVTLGRRVNRLACLGGLMAGAFEYVMDHGIGSGKDSPYKQVSNPIHPTCRSNV